MASPPATMEARMQELERSMSAMERRQEEQGKALELIAQRLGQLLREREVSPPPENPPQQRNLEREYTPEQARTPPQDHRNPPRRNVRRQEQVNDPWEWDRTPRRQELGRKIELPLFSGEDAYGWLARVERFFRLNAVEDDDKMELVMVAMEGEALIWYQWWEDQVPFPTWREFKEDLIKRFQPGVARNPMGPLLKLRQTGCVLQYRRDFERVASTKRDLEPQVMMCIFLSGLKEEIQAELKVGQFRTLSAMMDKALELEERNGAWREGGVSKFVKGGGNNRVNPVYRAPGMSRQGESSGAAAYGERGGRAMQEGRNERGRTEPRRLSQEEWQERQRRGLCFKCGGHWDRDHVCPMRRMQLILVEEEEEQEENGDKVEEIVEEGEEGMGLKNMRISLNSLAGLTSNKSFKVRGEIQGRDVLVLVDSGASGNFLNARVAKELQLKVKKVPPFTIEVGNGQKEQGAGVCCGLELKIQGISIIQNFFLMEMGGSEVVLGMDWLSSLGKIQADFKEMTLQWKEGGKLWEIMGDPSLCKARASWKATLQVLKEDGEGYMITPWQDVPIVNEQDGVPHEIYEVLKEFPALFQVPVGLPPSRECDHSIMLKEGATIPNIRPYRYPCCQKTEIERIVNEMLQAGIIQHSVSPYCSPVI